ncbi:MAG: thioredoxin domain-containing protein [Chloroflexota bacterium]
MKQNRVGFSALFVLLVILTACQPAEPIAPNDAGQADEQPQIQMTVVPVEAADVVEPNLESVELVEESPRPTQAAVEVVSEESENGTEEVDNTNREPNRLINEKSPYLLQHAYNPVNWYPWGEEAFATAAAEDKPVFLSIGYSTCHWCHVMRGESFEDQAVADLMNANFINIKVDREERPDIDSIYMTVAQITGNRGGWPLTIIMTPDQLPFFTATYIPKESRFERTGMLDLVPQVGHAWVNQRPEILEYADIVVEALQESQTVQPNGFEADGPVNVLDSRTLDTAFIQLDQSFDPVFGGFGGAPKFPSPHNLLFLLRYGQRTGDEKAVEMVEVTLRAMRLGGVYDQIGYGFHRYSTDERWKLPHFEKMLYDQAMLSMAYTETYQATGDEYFEEVAREIFTYVLRDMTEERGGFFSAEDADSEHEEGIFYMWTIPELQALLSPEDADIIIRMSQMSSEGNFLDEASGQPIGKNIVYWEQPPSITAGQFGMSEEELESRLDTIRETLFEVRELRIHPHKDDKILTDWNGLMIAAFAKAGRAFHEPEYTQAAQNAADFILSTLRDDDGRLLHRYRDGEAGIKANIDDYAYLIWGLLELYEATFDLRYLEEAIALQAELDKHLWDAAAGGYYFTPDDGEKLIIRSKETYDGAIPSGNSVSMSNLLRLGRITANTDYESQAFRLLQASYGQVSNAPTAFTGMLSGLEFGVGPSYEVIIVGEDGAEDTEAMLTALRDLYIPNKVVMLRGMADDGPLTQLADYTSFYYPLEEQATAYVCQNYVCEFPTNDPVKMVDLLLNSTEVETDG